LALILRQRARPYLLVEGEPHLGRRALLRAHVDRGGLVVADADRHEPADRLPRRRRRDALADLREDTVADGTAVQKAIVFHESCSSLRKNGSKLIGLPAPSLQCSA